MTILMATGFEDGTWQPFGTAAASTGADSGGNGPKTGAYHIYAYDMRAISYIFPTPKTQAYMSLFFSTGNWFAFNSTMWYMGLFSGGSTVAYITMNGDGKVLLYHGNNPTPIGPSVFVMNQYTYYHIEIGAVVGVSGSAEVRFGGTPVLTLASGDTRPGGGAGLIDRIIIHSGNGLFSCVDDVVVDDAAFPGEVRVIALNPNGAGNAQQFTPSTGTDHAALVDERPPTTTDYVYSTTPGHREQFALSDHGLSGGIIVEGVQVAMYANESESAGMTLDTGLRVNGTDYDDGKTHALQPAVARFAGKIWETNPDTGAPWTLEEINALQAGVKVL
jgi:hypothetical protein